MAEMCFVRACCPQKEILAENIGIKHKRNTHAHTYMYMFTIEWKIRMNRKIEKKTSFGAHAGRPVMGMQAGYSIKLF